MSKRNASRRKKQKANIVKIALSIAIPVATLTIGGFVMSSYMNQKSLNDNYCLEDSIDHTSAVFIDNSLQDLSSAHLRDYNTAFTQVYNRAKANTKILVFSTASHVTGSLAKPVYSICKPSITAEEQRNLGLPEKPAPYLEKRAKKVIAEYQQAVQSILSDVKEKTVRISPILDQLRAISKYDGFQTTQRSLTVITDGIENSEIGRFCNVKGNMPDFKTFQKRRDYRISIQPRSFKNTDVSLLLVEHGILPYRGMEYCSNHELRSWWVNYFEQNNARTVDLTALRYW